MFMGALANSDCFGEDRAADGEVSPLRPAEIVPQSSIMTIPIGVTDPILKVLYTI